MKRVVFITPVSVRYGFSLAGIHHVAVDPGKAAQALAEATAEPETSLIIMDERLIDEIGEDRIHEVEEGWRGVFLVLPSPEKPPPEVEDYAARLIRRAIGYHVRMRV